MPEHKAWGLEKLAVVSPEHWMVGVEADKNLAVACNAAGAALRIDDSWR